MRPGPARSTPSTRPRRWRAHRPGVLAPVAAVGLVLSGLLIGAPAAGAVGVTGSNRAPGPKEVRLPGPAPALPPGAQVVGAAAGAASVTAVLSLVPRHPAALSALADSVSETGSPTYREYVTTSQFAAKFGATPTTVAAIRNWLAPLGLEVGPAAADGLLLPVTGTVASVERAFAVPLVDARLPGGRVARMTTGLPRVPQPLAGVIGGVIGLSTVPQAHPQIRTVPVGATDGSAPSVAARPSGPGDGRAVAHAGPRACPAAAAVTRGGGAWTADQLASAYGFDALYGQGRSGVGQRVAIYELEPFDMSDIDAYQTCYGVHVPVSTVPVDGGATGTQSGEAALDIEAVAGLAPGSSIAVYSGPNSGAGPINTYAAMIDDRSNRVISTSWGQCEGPGGIDPAEQRAETVLFEQAAVQGQTVLAAAGDSGSSDCYDPAAGIDDTSLAVDDPADQPDVTGVGGTSLTGAVPTASSETVWNDGIGIGAGGGGVSKDFAAPAWQQIPDARNPFTTRTCGSTKKQQCREVPDVSASADPEHGDVIYFQGSWRAIGGTSAAAPLWAALTTVANQGCASPAGLLNPRLYAAGAGSSPPFNDVIRGNNDLLNPSSSSPHYPATAHYDLASGWGSPRAVPLMGLFSGSTGGCPSVTGLSSSTGPATGGKQVVIAGSGFGTGPPTVRFGRFVARVVSHAPTSITVITPTSPPAPGPRSPSPPPARPAAPAPRSPGRPIPSSRPGSSRWSPTGGRPRAAVWSRWTARTSPGPPRCGSDPHRRRSPSRRGRRWWPGCPPVRRAVPPWTSA